MTINSFFKSLQPGVSTEFDLLQGLVTESIQINGVDVYYIPRTIGNENLILHEDVLSSFDSYYKIECYIKDIDGFADGSDLLGKFGLFIKDSVELTFSRERFIEVTAQERPKEGDLIYFPMASALTEIKFAEDEMPFYQLGNLTMFGVQVELFQHSYEDFNTGLDEVDDDILTIEDDNVYSDNDVLETEGDLILDKSNPSPFGGY